MRLADISCRCCGKHYGVKVGCDICTLAKQNLVVDVVQDNDLEAMAQQSIRLLQGNMDRLEHEMMTAPHQGYAPQLATAAERLARALATIIGEARKLEERQSAKVQSMTFDERLELMVEFLEGLPSEQQELFLDRAVGLLAGKSE